VLRARRAQPDHRTAQRWLAALDAKRLGRVALVGDGAAAGRLVPAFWLDGQRAVWLRTAPAADAERLAAEAMLHARLALPGVATLVEHGVAGGTPYAAVAGSGRPLAAAADAPPVVLVAAAGRGCARRSRVRGS
jgi:hypothetical protein